LEAAPEVHPKRIAIVGHLFGRRLTLLSSDHDRTIRAQVGFAAAVRISALNIVDNYTRECLAIVVLKAVLRRACPLDRDTARQAWLKLGLPPDEHP
jgi:dienelactone hydrolase